jgi:AcrR family transcriptional regulator
MIYYYFATKDALFLASIEEPLGGLAQDLAACVDPSVEAGERIERLHARLRSLGELESVAVRIVLREALVSHERLDALRPALAPFVDLFARAIEDTHEGGALRSDVPTASLALALFGTSVAAPMAAALAGLGSLDLSAIYAGGARAR